MRALVKAGRALAEKQHWLFLVIGLHSLSAGIILILNPYNLIAYLGISVSPDPLFVWQTGIFHILLAVVYLAVFIDRDKYKPAIIFTLIVKTSAFMFLIIYIVFERLMIFLIPSAVVEGVFVFLISYSMVIKTKKPAEAGL